MPLDEKFKELLLKEILKNTPENLINKLVDLELGIFYSVKNFNGINFKFTC